MTLPPNTTSIVAYMKYEGGTEVYFDDLKIELNAVPGVAPRWQWWCRRIIRSRTVLSLAERDL
jgi:hypothetical protein